MVYKILKQKIEFDFLIFLQSMSPAIKVSDDVKKSMGMIKYNLEEANKILIKKIFDSVAFVSQKERNVPGTPFFTARHFGVRLPINMHDIIMVGDNTWTVIELLIRGNSDGPFEYANNAIGKHGFYLSILPDSIYVSCFP